MSKIKYIFLMIVIVSLAVIIAYLNYSISIIITSFLTNKTVNQEIEYLQTFQQINNVLINTENLHQNIITETKAIEVFPRLGYVTLIASVVDIVLLYIAYRRYSDAIQLFIDKIRLPKLDVIITSLFAFYAGIAGIYFSSLDTIKFTTQQTIPVLLSISLTSQQQTLALEYLEKLLTQMHLQYFANSLGFCYFSISAIYPLVGALLFFKKGKKLDLWSITLLITAFLAIPVWLVLFSIS